MNILLAVDGSSCSEAAVQRVIERFRPGSTHVRVLHAVEWLKEMPLCFQFGQGATSAHDVVESRTKSFADAQELVTRVQEQLKQAGFQTSVSTPDAEPRHAIVDTARQWPADLIVLGSHGRTGVDRFFMGSVADAVVRHAKCSVMVERTAESSSPSLEKSLGGDGL
ncbi:MAG: universal stress protein [Vicinamibacterales bacterium]|nr:universal stress protein [Vicinamibacterales bacterium]